MNHRFFAQMSLFIIILSLIPSVSLISAEKPVVRALLFFSPSCPHCHKVITEDLPPIMDEFDDQVVILGINTYTEKGNELFLVALRHFNIPQEKAGVPMLVVGKTVLIGSVEIPQQFPEIVAKGLISGGINWPDIPGLAQMLENEGIAESNETSQKEDAVEENPGVEMQENIANANIIQEEQEEEETIKDDQSLAITSSTDASIVTTENMTMVDRFMQDFTGNSISTLVLIGMIFSVVIVGIVVSRSNTVLNQWPNWIVALLLVTGLLVAIYMAHVEITRSEAVCGPVGDCNTVQQSPYALLYGIIPIGLLGVLGYLVIGILWLVSVYGKKKWRKISLFSLWGLLLIGTLFSIYLTFLEPFVIGATCAWCLISAVVMTLLFWNSSANLQQIGGLSH